MSTVCVKELRIFSFRTQSNETISPMQKLHNANLPFLIVHISPNE